MNGGNLLILVSRVKESVEVMGGCSTKNHTCLLQYLRDGKWLPALACWELINLSRLEIYFINPLQRLFYRLEVAYWSVIMINRREQFQRRVIPNKFLLYSMRLHPLGFTFIFAFFFTRLSPLHNNQIQIIRMCLSLTTTVNKILITFTYRWKYISLFAIIN